MSNDKYAAVFTELHIAANRGGTGRMEQEMEDGASVRRSELFGFCVRRLFLVTLFALSLVPSGCKRASPPADAQAPNPNQVRGVIADAFMSMSVIPSSSLKDSANGACIGLHLKDRPDDEFDVGIALAKQSGLIPEASSFNTGSVSGWQVELTFNPKSEASILGPDDKPKGVIYAVDSIRIISQSGKP
jgi:hypothetical protein